MNTALSPIVSEFETEEQETSYDRWFRSRVEASLREASAPGAEFVPHDQVMADMEAIIAAAEIKQRPIQS